jgi:hypothetical protein
MSRQIRPRNNSSGRFDKTSKGDLSQRWYDGPRQPRTKATNDLLFFEETALQTQLRLSYGIAIISPAT